MCHEILCQVDYYVFCSETEYEDEFEMFLRGGETVLSGKPPKIDGLTPEQVKKSCVFLVLCHFVSYARGWEWCVTRQSVFYQDFQTARKRGTF